ncbi:GGDEF domain-containing protein [Paraburkholderia lycopersici]|uniref:diguanylate cyclase n=1 Tax=Paraburkholderia lycopersici TaxID=416944 RepID=A0A1G7CLD0_9BURK|nr:GGDEF domain-containing protein [Paraburkholderia lycopersici]SDE40162.1 diguanylate cyclase (GGDEF) domain-containing protein [Paraburkholderia lycopersici]
MLSAFTLFGILTVSCLMSVAILGSLIRSAVPGVSRWCLGYAMLAVASSWVLLAGAGAGAITMIGVSMTTLGAVMLLVQGTRQFFGVSPVRRGECVALLVVFVVLLYFTRVSPNVGARGMLISIGLAYGRITVGTLALRHAAGEGSRYACRLVTAAAWLGALVSIARTIAIAFGVVPSLSFLQPSPWNVALLGLAIVTLPCLSTGMVMLAHDRVLRKMEKLATIDELTGALTRRAFMEKANVLLSQARERGGALSIVILDIDNFKAVNDGFGHAVGDRLLAHVASVVAAQLGAGDLFGRLGGEEFAIVFASAGKHDAATLTNALRLAVERSSAGGVACTLSAGVGRLVPADTLESALVRADAALYVAKAAGRNRVIMTSEVDGDEAGYVAEPR